MNKPNCYECIHRGTLAGSAHSECRHPTNATMIDNPLAKVVAILGSARKIDIGSQKIGLEVKGNPHGIRNGWFNYPFNFDPVWLEECNGFQKKEDQTNA